MCEAGMMECLLTFDMFDEGFELACQYVYSAYFRLQVSSDDSSLTPLCADHALRPGAACRGTSW